MPVISLPSPTPYEYALLSTAIYSDQLHEKNKTYEHSMPAEQQLLANKGWDLVKFVELRNGYIGGIWINNATQQVVIVHRGSQNVTSWITDIESVVRLRPGEFITSALDMMKDPLVLSYRQQHFRLSTAGHSLGGLLAQICAYWAQRVEFNDTYYPDMSAMVFDSPGAADFMQVIQSNLVSEKERIKIAELKIHNFCAMPTIVSTFGTQTGTIWHLPAPEGVCIAFINDHRMVHILSGFDNITGQPKDFRRMLDWPQADYSAYESFSEAVEHLAVTAIQVPFRFLNHLYKGIKTKFGFNGQRNTWFDQLFKQEMGTSFYYTKTAGDNYRPPLEKLENDINQALKGHYSTFLTREASMQRIGIHHFDSKVQVFLWDIINAKQWRAGDLGWNDLLVKLYGDDNNYRLLDAFSIEQQGDKAEIVLLEPDAGNVFDFQKNLLFMLRDREMPSLHAFMGEKAGQLDTGKSRTRGY